jgi:sterol desaturase/sphingolipid hydroxylase (fatty acid hydroxylase superfamily)
VDDHFFSASSIEASVRLGVFLALLGPLAFAEHRRPRHHAIADRKRRWPSNLGLAIVDTLVLRLLLPWLAVDAALYAQAHGVGVLHALKLATAADWLVTIIALDVIIYWQHRLMHVNGLLWRAHRVHHSDIALDATSALRFHPLEVVLSMAVKISAILALGAPPGAVLLFEILLNGFALLTHANLTLPARIDRLVRVVLVTPEMHRIHHSLLRDERDSNFGFHLSIWDRLFGSYRKAPRGAAESFELGLPAFRAPHEQTLPALLAQPFRSTD